MNASSKFKSLKWLLITWVVMVIVSILLTHTTHTGPFLYYLFIAIGWPFLHYLRENTSMAFGISLAMEFAYVSVIFLLVSGTQHMLRRGGRPKAER